MRYQVLSPIKGSDGVVTTQGFVEVPDEEVAGLQAAGIIGEPEPAAEVVKDKKA